MGFLDRIEKKTMGMYQLFLARVGINVEVDTTLCANNATYPCKREHQCVTFFETRERKAKFSFYRCAGYIWLNTWDGVDFKCINVGPWSNNVWEEAGFIALLINNHESSDG